MNVFERSKGDHESSVLARSFNYTVSISFILLIEVGALGADRDLVGKVQFKLAQIDFKRKSIISHFCAGKQIRGHRQVDGPAAVVLSNDIFD